MALHAIITAMVFDARLADAWARLPDYLGAHVLVSLTALAIGLAISLPLALFAIRRPRCARRSARTTVNGSTST